MSFHKESHVKYWERCYRFLLPSAYTSNDSTRLTFACFTLCARNLLSMPLSPTECSNIRTWVLSLQHPDGGFCGSSTHAHDGHLASKGTANIAATFFALVCLAIAAEGETQARSAFLGVARTRLLSWLRSLQREDGSFGQNLWEGEITGGNDMRHTFLASCIRWMLRGHVEKDQKSWVEDIDVNGLVRHVRMIQTYDGGFAGSAMDESHAGYAYCGIAALWMLDRPLTSASERTGAWLEEAIPDRTALLKFLAYRQFVYLAEEEDNEEDEEQEGEEGEGENFILSDMSRLSLGGGCRHVGYNGRWNKKADTCYCWWACASLKMLGHSDFIDKEPSRRYLLDITQHQVGGFSKSTGGPPDIYHSYLALAALASMGYTDGLKEFDVGLCCSREVVKNIELARQGMIDRIDGESEK